MRDLLDKKIDDLTVGDSLKLQGYILGIAAGGVVVYCVGAVATKKIGDRLHQRKLRKQTD